MRRTRIVFVTGSLLLLLIGTVLANCVVAGTWKWRRIGSENGYTTYSLAINVQNSCATDFKVIARFRAVDANGYELTTAFPSGSVPSGTTKSLTDTALVKDAMAAQIVRWEFVDLASN